MLRSSLFFAACAVTMLLSSCASSRVQSLAKQTQETLELVKAEARRAIQLTQDKMKNYEVDTEIGKQVIQNLEGVEKKVDEQLAKVDEIDRTNNREAMLKFAEQTNVVIQSALTDLKSLNDLYEVSTFSQFETATFFPTGGYNIPTEKMEEARISMEPIVKRIIKFIAEHPKQKFVAVIVCSGFSDESPVGKESPLYQSLLDKMEVANPTRQQMNEKLSELRAKTIAKLLVDIIKTNEGLIPNPRLLNYDIRWMGRGEALPYPDKVKDYKAVDKRRRMVSLIWNVLPGTLYIEGVNAEATSLKVGN